MGLGHPVELLLASDQATDRLIWVKVPPSRRRQVSLDPCGTELKMNWLSLLIGIAIAHVGQNAFAKNRLTDPVKIARECKGEAKLLCKGLRPGGQRILSCLKEKPAELSPACWAALRSTE